MKVSFFSRINTWLFIFPSVIILVFYLALGFWIYSRGAADLFHDFHSAQLMTMLSDKKNSVELWFDIRIKALEEIAASNLISGDIRALAERTTRENKDSTAALARAPLEQGNENIQRMSKFVSGYGYFKSIYFVTQEGRLLWEVGREGQELADGYRPDEQILKVIPGKSSVFSGRIGGADAEYGILICAPVDLKDFDIKIFAIGRLNPASLASVLVVEKGFYETGRVALIDEQGLTLASRDMTEAGKLRYNVSAESGGRVDRRDGFFYMVAPLKFEGLRLIATLESSEAFKPLGPFLNLYLVFGVIIILVIFIQSVFVAPRILSRPFKRLAKAMQSASTGDFRAINIKKGFVGELKALSESFSSMIVGLSKIRSGVGDFYSAERSKTLMTHVLAVEAKGRLDSIKKTLKENAEASKVESVLISEALVELTRLSETIDAFNFLIRLKDGSFKPSIKKIDLKVLLKEVEEKNRALIGEKDIELAIERHTSIKDKDIFCDYKTLQTLISSLLRHAIRITGVGIVTLLASAERKGEQEYIELVLSDAGVGIDPGIIQWTTRGGAFPFHRVDIAVARELSEILGGAMAIENLGDKGSLITVSIPNRAPVESSDGEVNGTFNNGREGDNLKNASYASGMESNKGDSGKGNES